MEYQESTSTHGNKVKDSRKTLVVYNSKFGSTGEVADFIGNILSENGKAVEIKKIREEVDLYSYDNIVIGSAIQYDKWMGETREFVKKNQKILSKIPVAFFFTCLVLSKKTDKSIRQADGYSEKLYHIAPGVRPISVGGFAGVLNFSKMSFILRLIFRLVSKITGVREGDYRDWDAIGSWARSIDFSLLANSVLDPSSM